MTSGGDPRRVTGKRFGTSACSQHQHAFAQKRLWGDNQDPASCIATDRSSGL